MGAATEVPLMIEQAGLPGYEVEHLDTVLPVSKVPGAQGRSRTGANQGHLVGLPVEKADPFLEPAGCDVLIPDEKVLAERVGEAGVS